LEPVVANQGTGLLEAHCQPPDAMSVQFTDAKHQELTGLVPRTLVARIVLPNIGMADHAVKNIKVLHRKGPQGQALGLYHVHRSLTCRALFGDALCIPL